MKKLLLLSLFGAMLFQAPCALGQSGYSLPTKAEDMYQLGWNYYYGRNGVEQDYNQAVYWYQKAAELDHAGAQCDLGLCYKKGLGVQKDWKKAFYWYTRSANQGNMYAQYNLAFCYKNGEGCEQDYSLAEFWYRKSAEQGDSDAQNGIGVLYYNGTGVSRDYAQAYSWFKKAADKGNEYGEYNLGICYENGNGVAKDLDQAKQWYKKAADHGHSSAKEAYNRLNAAPTSNSFSSSSNNTSTNFRYGETYYYKSTESSQYIAVRFYESKMVCASFDTDKISLSAFKQNEESQFRKDGKTIELDDLHSSATSKEYRQTTGDEIMDIYTFTNNYKNLELLTIFTSLGGMFKFTYLRVD